MESHGVCLCERGPQPGRGLRWCGQEVGGGWLGRSATVGVIGFSRSVYHTLEALTHDRPSLAAASILDGVTFGYVEYILAASARSPGVSTEADPINGGPPFGDGLQHWLANSPGFNMDKVKAPLLVLAPGRLNALADWEPYAALYYLRKPVDMILLQAGEHVQNNPVQQLATAGANVDWFRFWLQGFEDASPAKAEQYRRWESLCDLQRMNNPDRVAFCVSTQRQLPDKH